MNCATKYAGSAAAAWPINCGHHQYAYRKERGLGIRYDVREFASENDARAYALEMHLGRRSLNAGQRATAVAMAMRIRGPGNPKLNNSNTTRNSQFRHDGGIDVKAAAEKARTSERTIQRAVAKLKEKKPAVARNQGEQSTDFDPVKLEKQLRRRQGKEIVTPKQRKEADSLFGKLIRTLDQVGLRDNAYVQHHLKAVSKLLIDENIGPYWCHPSCHPMLDRIESFLCYWQLLVADIENKHESLGGLAESEKWPKDRLAFVRESIGAVSRELETLVDVKQTGEP